MTHLNANIVELNAPQSIQTQTLANLANAYKDAQREAKALATDMKAIKERMLTYEVNGRIQDQGIVYATNNPVTRTTVMKKELEIDYPTLFGEGSKYLKVTTSCVFRIT